MSTIKEIIARVDAIKPNAFDDATKVNWLASLEGKIAADVFLMSFPELAQFRYTVADSMDTEPLVSFPHDDVYDLWLCAQIDLANGEYNKYQNTMVSYNESYGNFVRWFARVYEPSQRNGHPGFCLRSDLPVYYITAYGLAVKQGFMGSLDEWLESLKGEKGDPGTSAYEYAIQGGFEGTEEDFAEKMAKDNQDIDGLDAMRAHVGRQDNPHGVTAAQVGARPDNWLPTVEEINGLVDALAGKAESEHGHEMAGINGLMDALAGKAESDHGHELEGINGLVDALAGKAPSNHNHDAAYAAYGHNHDSVYAKFIATITTGSCDDILVPLTLRDIRTNNDELYNMFATGGTKGENYAYIITLFLSNVNADASRVQIAVGYTNAYIATRAYYSVTGWKPWNMMMSSILHPYFYGDTLPDPGTPGRIFFLTQ